MIVRSPKQPFKQGNSQVEEITAKSEKNCILRLKKNIKKNISPQPLCRCCKATTKICYSGYQQKYDREKLLLESVHYLIVILGIDKRIINFNEFINSSFLIYLS